MPRNIPLHPFNPSSRPWETITVDLIGPLPESKGCNAILTIVCQAIKAVKFEPTTINLDAPGFAQILLHRVFREHGWFRRIISDRDKKFIGKYITELCELTGIKQNPAPASHPQTD